MHYIAHIRLMYMYMYDTCQTDTNNQLLIVINDVIAHQSVGGRGKGLRLHQRVDITTRSITEVLTVNNNYM